VFRIDLLVFATVVTFDVRPADTRLVTDTEWLDSRHSFAFGHHYEPDNTHFGLLMANNADTLAPGTGYDAHPHRDVEIVTWVIAGSLVHADSDGNTGLIYPGLAQRMSAGSGIQHSERNDRYRLPTAADGGDGMIAADGTIGGDGDAYADLPPVRFVQMWIAPSELGIAPSYQQRDINDLLAGGDLVTVASGLPQHRDEAAIRLHQTDAGLSAARLPARGVIELPVAEFVHVYIVAGEVLVEDAGVLSAGDAARVTLSDGRRLTATGAAEVLLWQMRSSLT